MSLINNLPAYVDFMYDHIAVAMLVVAAVGFAHGFISAHIDYCKLRKSLTNNNTNLPK